MAHFAKLDNNNTVIEIHCVANAALDVNNEEQSGIEFLTEWSDGYTNWVQTSYNTHGNVHTLGGTPLHKNYAGIGYHFDGIGFYAPQPYPSWTKNADTYLWEAPVAMPTDGKRYDWDEDAQNWVEIAL